MGDLTHFQQGIRVRVAVVILYQERLLLARQNNRDFWVLPGGTLEKGESLVACAQREIKEETGLIATIGPLLYVSEFIQDTIHVVDTFFWGEVSSHQLTMETTENLNALQFFTWSEAQQLPLQPQSVMRDLLLAWKAGALGVDRQAQYLRQL